MMASVIRTILAVVWVSTLAAADTQKYEIRPELSSLSFSVSAKLHMVHGKGGEFSGMVIGDPADITATKIVVRLDPKTFDTDNKKRDKTMREKSLELQLYPLIEFEANAVEAESIVLVAGRPTEAVVHGILKLHGVEANLAVSVKILWEEERLSVEADLNLKLDDFKIYRPRILFVKLQNDISIHIKIGALKTAGGDA